MQKPQPRLDAYTPAAHGKAATGGYHEDAGGKGGSRAERADDDRDPG